MNTILLLFLLSFCLIYFGNGQECASLVHLRMDDKGLRDVDVHLVTNSLDEVEEKLEILGKTYRMERAGMDSLMKHHKQKCYGVGVGAQTCSVQNYSFKESRYANISKNGTVSLINGTTRSTVPQLFKEFLLTRASIDECASDFLPAARAVEKLEEEVGWNAEKSTFNDPSVLENLVNQGIGEASVRSDTSPISLVDLSNRPIHELMDIVVPSIRDLEFLEAWKPFIEKFHIIVIQDGDPMKQMKIPSWANYELYNRNDIVKALGLRSWIISTRDASIRNFGFLVSDKDFIYTLDDDCLPARDNDGHLVDAITQHLYNLLSPSTPYFFNTVYDPYRPGVDFVRGYPYSLRDGVTTAVSHGLWMNAYDYDAPTQLLKVAERNTRYHDMTQTIPSKVFYPMCSMNVAFNRKLIGPAFMQGLMGDGQPWARYDDMFAGWASKLIGDHLGMGTKSGAPYIYHNKSSNPFANLKKEYKGLFWQEILIDFFHGITLSSTSNTASKAYRELADLVLDQLSPINPYFIRLSNAMKLWIEVWQDRFGGRDDDVDCQVFNKTVQQLQYLCVPKWLPVASRSSMGPKHEDSTCAIFTIVYNEAVFLPVWLRYYLQHAHPDDIWVLDHNTADGSTAPELLHGVNYKKLYGETSWMPHHFINRQVELHIQRLLRAGYKCVLFTEVDEMIVTDPKHYPMGLKEYMKSFVEDKTRYHVRVIGYEVGHVSQGGKEEPALDWNQPILMQREYMMLNHMFSKALLSKLPIRYHPGHHHAWTAFSTLADSMPIDRSLIMLHLHSVDKTYCVQREENKLNNAKERGRRDESKLGINTLIDKPFDAYQQCCLALLGEEELDTPPCVKGQSDTWLNKDNLPLMRIPSGWKVF